MRSGNKFGTASRKDIEKARPLGNAQRLDTIPKKIGITRSNTINLLIYN